MSSLLSNWKVHDLNKHRRQSVLVKCKGDTFLAGQILLNHYKASRNPEVINKARSDALYFFALTKQKRDKNNGKH